jgi:hypothetical protein
MTKIETAIYLGTVISQGWESQRQLRTTAQMTTNTLGFLST